MIRNRVFVLSILAVLAILIPSAVRPALAAPKNTGPYQAELTAWTISGNAGVAGAVLSYDDGGITKTVTAGAGGSYSILVPDGWVGVVTPALAGYTFSPTSITYSTPGVTADTSGQNYTATPNPTATRTRTATQGMTATRTLTPGKTPTPTTPSGFTKIYPWNGATSIGLTSVTFTWRAYSPAPDKYRYCVDTSNNDDCDAGGGYTSVNGTSVTLSNLTANKTYYWHVQAITCLACVPKTVVDTNNGTWWSFTTGSAPTATPTRTATRAPTRTPTKTPTPATLTVVSTGAYDGWILESTENSGVGGTLNAPATTFQLGDDASNRQYRAILSFDTSSLPDHATIKSIVVKISQSGAPVGTNPFTVLGSLKVDIRQGFFGSALVLALDDFNATGSAGQIGTFDETPVSGWYSATLNATALTKVNLTGPTQLRVYFSTDDNNNLAANYMNFVSGNAGSGKPQLMITYTTP